MKCPFKPIKIHKNRYGQECYSADPVVAKIEIDFGDCDRGQCMAYNPDKQCDMMKLNIKRYDI